MPTLRPITLFVIAVTATVSALGCKPLPAFPISSDTSPGGTETQTQRDTQSSSPTDDEHDSATSSFTSSDTDNPDSLTDNGTQSGSEVSTHATDTESGSESLSASETETPSEDTTSNDSPVACNAAKPAEVAALCGDLPCVDGYCCNEPCDGLCEACNLVEAPGVCSFIPNGEDPLLECMQQLPETCGQTGVCDGHGRCERYGWETKCEDGKLCTFDDGCWNGLCGGIPLDCGVGSYCDESLGECANCFIDSHCGDTCEACETGTWCAWTHCIECHGDYDCPLTQVCENEECRASTEVAGCGGDEPACGEGTRCIHGKCRVVVTQLAAGTDHSCAVLSNGKVRCWGSNDHGQLGYGHTQEIGDDEAPALAGDIDLGGTAVKVTAGFAHTCALLDTGHVRCWGWGEGGRLGYGNTLTIGDDEPPATAGDVDLGGPATHIEAGYAHTCALMSTKKVRCWGPVPWTYLGYETLETVGDDETPASMGDVVGLADVVQIAAGTHHTCALLGNGRVRCWGNGNYEGQTPFGYLGYGNNDSKTLPDEDVSVGYDVIKIAAGGYHTCVRRIASQPLLCWGRGADGTLGNGSDSSVGDNETPFGAAPVQGYAPSSSFLDDVYAGERHNCIVSREAGKTVACWGRGDKGQLGGAETRSWNQIPPEPMWVSSPQRVSQVAAGGSHTCALLEDGRVRCWGGNDHGQLGLGMTSPVGDNEKPQTAGFVAVVRGALSISMKEAFACAVLSDGIGSCWGYLFPDSSPRSAQEIDLGTAARQVSTGIGHACVLSGDGDVFCFGNNGYGQLGYGHQQDVSIEDLALQEAVDLGGAAVQVAAGENHTCALLVTGDVQCWGSNSRRQLGNDNPEIIGDNEAPVTGEPVDLGGLAIEISAGYDHTCALLEDGGLRCWGANFYGQLGYGHQQTVSSPALAGDIDLGEPVAHVATAMTHTCAQLASGGLRCWGNGLWGKLGLGDTVSIGDDEVPSSVPLVNTGSEIMGVATGARHTCALTIDDGVMCFGDGDYGLGYGNTNDVGATNIPADAGYVALGPRRPLRIGAGDWEQGIIGSGTCVLFSSGGVRCLGGGAISQQCDERTTRHLEPVSIGDDETPLSGCDALFW